MGPLCHPWVMFGGESGTGNPAVRSGHIRHAVANRGVLRTRQSHGWQSGPTDEEQSGGTERRCQSPNMEKMGNYTFFMLPRFGARHLYCHLLSPLQRGSRAILATRPAARRSSPGQPGGLHRLSPVIESFIPPSLRLPPPESDRVSRLSRLAFLSRPHVQTALPVSYAVSSLPRTFESGTLDTPCFQPTEKYLPMENACPFLLRRVSSKPVPGTRPPVTNYSDLVPRLRKTGSPMSRAPQRTRTAPCRVDFYSFGY